jgi:citrate synthase
MTREPDRFDQRVLQVLMRCRHASMICTECIAAALRQSADEGLNEAAQAFAEAPTTQHSGAAVASILRYLTRDSAPQSAVAPAADQDEVAMFGAFGHGEPAEPVAREPNLADALDAMCDALCDVDGPHVAACSMIRAALADGGE